MNKFYETPNLETTYNIIINLKLNLRNIGHIRTFRRKQVVN